MGSSSNTGISGTPIVKKYTTYPVQNVIPDRSVCTFQAYEDHPSYITGMEALQHFHFWVANAVLPIAFRWIDENYDEVYANIAPDNQDDVGVVIAAALELIQTTEIPAEQRERLKKIKEEKTRGKIKAEGVFDPTGVNVVWSRITSQVRTSTAEIFNAESNTLDNTNGYEKTGGRTGER